MNLDYWKQMAELYERAGQHDALRREAPVAESASLK